MKRFLRLVRLRSGATMGLSCLATALFAPVLAAAAADFTGIWQASGDYAALSTLDHEAPPLTAEAARIYQRHRAARAADDLSWDSATRCIPLGVSRILGARAPFEILQEPATITMLFQTQRLYRKIYLDAAAPVNSDSTFMGQSFGHWEGDTLVIQTRNFKPDTSLDDSGLPHSEDLQLTERLRIVKPGLLVDRIRIEDDKTFSRPWETAIVLKRRVHVRIAEDICVDRIHR
jgi:hypothetical protein